MARSLTSHNVDLKVKLHEYVPVLFEILNHQNVKWDKLNRRFDEWFRVRKEKAIQNGGTYTIYFPDITFYDVISQAHQGSILAIMQLDFINKLFEELSDELTKEDKAKIHDPLIGILTEFKFHYLHAIGELMVLNHIVKGGLYSLEEIEFPLPNGKKADFLLKDSKTKKNLLVEVLNTHLHDNLSDDPADIKEFLTNEAKNKNFKKGKNLDSDMTYLLVMVLWGSSANEKKVSAFYKAGHTVDVRNMTEPCASKSFSNQEGVVIHRFGTISTLFDIQETG